MVLIIRIYNFLWRSEAVIYLFICLCIYVPIPIYLLVLLVVYARKKVQMASIYCHSIDLYIHLISDISRKGQIPVGFIHSLQLGSALLAALEVRVGGSDRSSNCVEGES